VALAIPPLLPAGIGVPDPAKPPSLTLPELISFPATAAQSVVKVPLITF